MTPTQPVYWVQPGRTSEQVMLDVEQKVLVMHARMARVETRLARFMLDSGLNVDGSVRGDEPAAPINLINPKEIT